MRFGIHSNKTRDLGYEVAQELASVMLSHGHVPVFREYMMYWKVVIILRLYFKKYLVSRSNMIVKKLVTVISLV